MKRIVIIRAALMAALTLGLALSCAKEEPVIDTPVNPSIIRASIPEATPESSKVSLTPGEGGSGLAMAWEEGDQLTVIGNTTEQFTINEGFTDHNATFSGNPVSGESFTVLYPGKTYTTVAAINARSYTSQVQNGNANTDHLEWNAMIKGIDDYSSLTFSGSGCKQNGALKFYLQLPAEFSTVEWVSLSTADGSQIFSASNDPSSEKVSELKLNLSNVDVSASSHILTAYMMVSWNENAIAAGTVLQIKVKGAQGDPWVKTKTVGEQGFTIAGGKVTRVQLNSENWDEPLFWGGSGTQADPYQIKTLKHLKNIDLDAVNTIDTYFKLVDDIALSAEEAAAFEEIKNFKGHIDGNNHTITGLTTPLIGNFYGWASNLDITANITFNGTDPRINGVDYGIGILAHYLNLSETSNNTVSNVTVRGSLTVDGVSKTHNYMVGGLAGSSNSVPVSGCKNYANVTVENLSVGENASRIGGLIGALQNSGGTDRATDCENHGTVTVNSVTATKQVSIGGVFGHSTQPVNIKNCDNLEGSVLVTFTSTGNIEWNAVGGILGSCEAAVNMQNCDNAATVSNANTASAATAAKYSTGGVAGRIQNTPTISSCSSTGNISGVSFVGGILGSNTNGGAKITSCWSSGTLTALGTTDGVHYIGGIAGEFVGTLEKSHSTMTITKSESSSKYPKGVGGLVGGAYTSSMTLIIKECYYNGTMAGATQLGGLVGHSRRNVQIENSYSAGSITGTAGYMAAIIGYVNNAATCTVTNCYSKMDVATTGSGNAIGGLIGGADTTKNSWDVSGLLAWNNSISFQTNNTTDGVVIGQMQSGTPTEGSTSFSNCWYRNDMSYKVKGTEKTLTSDNDVTTGGKKIYNGKRADAGVTCQAKADELGWDSTKWKLDNADGYPTLLNVVQ